MHYLQEHDDEQLTVSDLAKKWKSFVITHPVIITIAIWKQKIEDHFGENVITSVSGKPNLI